MYNCVDGEWVVDADHVAMLDYAWDLDIVREATYAALAAVGKDNMHFRPPDEQNEHKVSAGNPCCMHAAARCNSALQTPFQVRQTSTRGD